MSVGGTPGSLTRKGIIGHCFEDQKRAGLLQGSQPHANGFGVGIFFWQRQYGSVGQLPIAAAVVALDIFDGKGLQLAAGQGLGDGRRHLFALFGIRFGR